MRRILAALAAGAAAIAVAKRYRDSLETKSTWQASTDRVD